MGKFGRRTNFIAAPLLAVGIGACGGGNSSAEAPYSKAPTTAAATAPGGPVLGYDASWPQCGGINPETHSTFAVIGINYLKAYTSNSCFREQFTQAEKLHGVAGLPTASVYILPADPGPTSSHWPKSGTNADGTCKGGNSLACARGYGEALAEDDLTRLTTAKVGAVALWWYDVEDTYSWQSPALNDAVLEGMTDVFGETRVGIYTSPTQWQSLAGLPPKGSSLRGLPVWVLGATTVAEAEGDCNENFGGLGRVRVVQVAAPDGGVDSDVACTA